MKKYFDILELDESASIEDLERAYKELSNAWRPENYQNLPRYRRKAETKLREINSAYERLKSYLAVRPQAAAQSKRPAPEAAPDQIEPDPGTMNAQPEPQNRADRLPEPEAETAPDRSADMPPWEPERPTQPAAENSRPQIQRTAYKSLLFGFVAILAVLGVLLFFRAFNRQTAPEPQSQTPLTEKAQPAVAATRPQKAPDPKTQTPEIERSQTVSQSTQPEATAQSRIKKPPPAPAAEAPGKIDYQKALSQEVLSPYNRDPARVRRIQKSLTASGYDTGPVDGIIGPYTSAALQQFAGDHNMGSENLFAPHLADAVVLYAEVTAEHPNWHQIIGGDDFTDWLNSQTYYRADQIQTFKKSATTRQVNDILELYKLEGHLQPD